MATNLYNVFFEQFQENIMDMYATTVYVITDEVLRALKIKDDPQVHMTNAEVITFAIISSKFFYSNFTRARFICKELKLFKKMLSNSRLNRRIRAISWEIWKAIFRFLALIFSKENQNNEYIVDSFPVSCCEKSRIDKRKIFLRREHMKKKKLAVKGKLLKQHLAV
jgi:hypothetical protein